MYRVGEVETLFNETHLPNTNMCTFQQTTTLTFDMTSNFNRYQFWLASIRNVFHTG